MRDERRPGLDGPGRMVKSREFGPQNYVSYEIWGFLKRSILLVVVYMRNVGLSFLALTAASAFQVRFSPRRRALGAFSSPKVGASSAAPSADDCSPALRGLLDVSDSPDALEAAVCERYGALTQDDMVWLQRQSLEQAVNVRSVMAAVEAETGTRMDRARARLEQLLEAGEIQKLGRQITKMVNEGAVDEAFLTVLNQNVQAAAMDEAGAVQTGGPSRHSILSHVSTCIQEELETRTDPEVALLHKLVRTSDAGLRGRILRHYLAPQREILLPDTTSIPLDPPKEARVAPMQFSKAVLNLVATLRSLDVDGEMVVQSISDVQQVAKEARQVIQEDTLYDDSLLEEFSLSLIPAFGGSES